MAIAQDAAEVDLWGLMAKAQDLIEILEFATDFGADYITKYREVDLSYVPADIFGRTEAIVMAGLNVMKFFSSNML